MSQLRIVTGRAFVALWVAGLGFLALAQPAHALFGSPTVALIAQAVGAVLLGALFELRGAIRQQCERLSAFLVRSRGLRAVVRTLAVSTIAGPSAEAAGGDATNETPAAASNPRHTALSPWRKRDVASSAASVETSLQTAASAPLQSIPPVPPTTA